MHEKSYPTEETLGDDCLYWKGVDIRTNAVLANLAIGCRYPKFELEGRLSCEGIIDDVCLYMLNGRRPPSLTDVQIDMIKQEKHKGYGRRLPPGDVH